MASKRFKTLFSGSIDSTNPDLERFIRSSRYLFIVFGILWLVLYTIDNTFTYLRAGSDIIYQKKYELIASKPIFPKDANYKLAMFGNSKTLSGLLPELFDEQVDSNGYTFNFGLPNVGEFVYELEKLIHKGDVPTHVLLQVPWDDREEKSLFDDLKSSNTIINTLIPFRQLPRNFTIFVYFSLKNGGPVFYYQQKKTIVDQMILDRGYHFIIGQSHFPNHQLPANFTLDADLPNHRVMRTFHMNVPLFSRLKTLANKYGFRVFLVPEYFRTGSVAPALDVNLENQIKLKEHNNFKILGPDYILLDNRYFSDPVHLNPEGARKYTMYLAELVASEIRKTDSGI